jgi:peroxiredoxin
MRIRVPAVALFCLAAVFGADPRIRIAPAKPIPGNAVTVTYAPKGGPLERAKTFTLVYGFDAWAEQRTPLKLTEGRHFAEVLIPATAVYFWCQVQGATPEEADTNRGGVWDTYLYDAKGLPSAGARRTRAEVYLISQQPPDKNLIRLILLEEELHANPADGVARGWWWALRYEDSGQTVEVRDEILGEITRFLDQNRDKPWAYQAAALGYNHMRRDPQAVEVMRAFVERLPEDDSLDDLVLQFFGNSGKAADLESLEKRSKRWAGKADYWNRLLQAYGREKAEPEKLVRAGRGWLALVAKDKDAGGGVRSRIAEMWLAGGADPAAAEQVARDAVSISELGPRPTSTPVSPVSRRLAPGFIVHVNRNTFGWALYARGRYEEARQEFERAIAVRENEQVRARALFLRLGQTLEKLGRPAEAMTAYAKEMAWGTDDRAARDAAATLYRKTNSGEAGFEAELRSQVNELRSQKALAEGAWTEDSRDKVNRFELPDQDGRLVTLNQYRGRIVLVEFWATWCGSCLRSMEHTSKLKNAHPNEVVVLAVSLDAEETRQQAAQFLKEQRYDFVLLFDQPNRHDLPVTFVPARFLVDRTGLLRVREYGWSTREEPAFEQRLRDLMAEAEERR